MHSLPLGAPLDVDTRTTVDAVHVELPLTFEGAFNVSSLIPPRVEFDPRAIDPSGTGRRRVVKLSEQVPVVHGDVAWTTLLGLPRPRRQTQGRVNMQTTINGGATLQL